MPNTSTSPDFSDNSEPRKVSIKMTDAFLAVVPPSNEGLPRVGKLKQSKSFTLCSGETFEIEIRETESAVLIYLLGRLGGAVDVTQFLLLKASAEKVYDRDPRPQYMIGDQVEFVVRMSESGGRTVAKQLTRKAAFAEILGKPSAKGSEPAQPAEPPPMTFLIVRHADWCPGVHGDGANCICDSTIDEVDRDTWGRSYTATANRAARRAAARKAAKKGRL